ncbi:RNA binding protein, putative [Babesia bigemina]|uniref:RNA binding protein, putative n=1 Tax=Babesia bigemina TaxID=5866 RepID=A0A061DE20_BABBI|nr:RNA binding protein, putative [Babesia bigemina]CDR97889.1 RNA binding protein, putative [Babesia bigemina]|eukprot:XP_012770075.1 RNA binding protein, putative [Babesia bigemina]
MVKAVDGDKAARKAKSASEFSTENMLRDIKKVVKAFGGGIMKSSGKSKKSKSKSMSLPVVKGKSSMASLISPNEDGDDGDEDTAADVAAEQVKPTKGKKEKPADRKKKTGDGDNAPADGSQQAEGKGAKISKDAMAASKKVASLRQSKRVSTAAVKTAPAAKTSVKSVASSKGASKSVPLDERDDDSSSSGNATLPQSDVEMTKKTSVEKTPATKLLFTNVKASDEAFKTLINSRTASCGPYLKCFMASAGKCVVLVASEEIAKAYVSYFNGYELNGEAMSVDISTRGPRGTAKKLHMPSKESFKTVTLKNIPKVFERDSVAKALESVDGVKYKSLKRDLEGNWAVGFETVPDCVKFTSLVNGCFLTFANETKTKKVKVMCGGPSFGTKASHAGRVFVQNLKFTTTAAQLEKLAHRFDKGAKVHMPKSGKKGFAFIQFSNIQVAEKAILRLNGTDFEGRKIRLALSLPTELYKDQVKTVDGKAEAESAAAQDKKKDLDEGDEVEEDEEADADDSDDEEEEEDEEDDEDESEEEDDEDEGEEDEEEEEEDDEDEEDDEGEDEEEEDEEESEDQKTSGKGKPLRSSAAKTRKNDESDRTIFVRNLSYESTEAALREYFATFGAVESCNICKDAKGVSRGTAFILFQNADDARKILAMEELALERDADFSLEGARSARNKVKHGPAAGLGFSLNGRRLILSRALSRDEASTLAKAKEQKRSTAPNSKKRNDLLMEGVILETSPEFQKLTAMEQKLQTSSFKEKLEKMKNPNMFLNPKRLCVRNLPPNADVNELRRAIVAHFRRNVDLSSICGSKKVDASRTIGKVTFLSDEKRKVKVGESTMRRRMPFAFIDFNHEELALQALRFLSCNADVFGARYRLFAEFAIEDSRALYIQKKRKEQYEEKLKERIAAQEDEEGAAEDGKKRKKRKTYSRGKLQRMKRRKLREAAAEQPAAN